MHRINNCIVVGFYVICYLIISGCKTEPVTQYVMDSTPYSLNVPSNFPQPDIPANNPLTIAKVKLGRMLYYDPIVSVDSTLTCARCHNQKFNFNDSTSLSINLSGPTKRNSMSLINLAFTNKFFWDGRKVSLEEAVQDALNGEQKFNFTVLNARLSKSETYKKLFGEAFGSEPKEEHIKMAIASFVRTIISAGSPFDMGAQKGDYKMFLGASAIRGATIFSTEKGDCFHCHGDIPSNNLFTDNDFHNNGLDTLTSPDVMLFKDYGHGKVTDVKGDYAKFRTPSLRNIIYSGPYFHDGRTADFDDVMKHYNETVFNSPTIDANMKKVGSHGIKLTNQETFDLKNFILSLTDTAVISNPIYSTPFK